MHQQGTQEIPVIQKKTDFPLNLFNKENIPTLYSFITRNVNTGLLNIAAFANYEAIIRYQALLNVEAPAAEWGFGIPPISELSEKELFFLVHDTADNELKKLH